MSKTRNIPPQYHLWLYAVLDSQRVRRFSAKPLPHCPPRKRSGWTQEDVVPHFKSSDAHHRCPEQTRSLSLVRWIRSFEPSLCTPGGSPAAQKFPLLILEQSKYLSQAKYWEVLLPDDRRSRWVLSHQAIGLVKIISRDNVLHTIYDNKMAWIYYLLFAASDLDYTLNTNWYTPLYTNCYTPLYTNVYIKIWIYKKYISFHG